MNMYKQSRLNVVLWNNSLAIGNNFIYYRSVFTQQMSFNFHSETQTLMKLDYSVSHIFSLTINQCVAT